MQCSVIQLVGEVGLGMVVKVMKTIRGCEHGKEFLCLSVC
jgi:hypothetical protein